MRDLTNVYGVVVARAEEGVDPETGRTVLVVKEVLQPIRVGTLLEVTGPGGPGVNAPWAHTAAVSEAESP